MNRHEKPMFALQVAQQIEDRRLHRDVERRHRLVGDEHARLDDQRAREADALALAAGELVRIAVPQLGAQADLRRTSRSTRASSSRPRARPVQPQRLADDVAAASSAG